MYLLHSNVLLRYLLGTGMYFNCFGSHEIREGNLGALTELGIGQFCHYCHFLGFQVPVKIPLFPMHLSAFLRLSTSLVFVIFLCHFRSLCRCPSTQYLNVFPCGIYQLLAYISTVFGSYETQTGSVGAKKRPTI